MNHPSSNFFVRQYKNAARQARALRPLPEADPRLLHPEVARRHTGATAIPPPGRPSGRRFSQGIALTRDMTSDIAQLHRANEFPVSTGAEISPARRVRAVSASSGASPARAFRADLNDVLAKVRPNQLVDNLAPVETLHGRRDAQATRRVKRQVESDLYRPLDLLLGRLGDLSNDESLSFVPQSTLNSSPGDDFTLLPALFIFDPDPPALQFRLVSGSRTT